MPDPIREQVIQAVETTVGPIEIDSTPVTVHRNRASPVDTDKAENFPIVAIYDSNHNVDNSNHGFPIHHMEVRVEIWVRAASDIGTRLNELYAMVVQSLTQNNTLFGLAIDVQEIGMEDINLDLSKPRSPTAGAEIVFDVSYPVTDKNPYTQPPF